MLRPILALACLTAPFSLTTPANAYCMTGSVDYAIERADALFVGVPILQTSFPFNPETFTNMVTAFQVLDVLKGEQMEVVNVWHCTACSEGLSFRTGEHVLVSAHSYEGKLLSSYCSLGEYSLGDVRTAMRKASKSP